MKRTIALLLVVVTLLTGVTMAFSSCSEVDNDPGADIHLFLSSRIYDLDPTLAIVDDDAAQILSLLYEPLFKLNADGSVSGALAKSYKINKKAGTLTIKLRNTNWSDSTPVTSNDVLFAWQRLLAPDFENPAAALLYDVKNALYIKQGSSPDGETITIADLGVEAPDDDTLVITFSEDLEYIDYNEFLRSLTSIALSPVPENTVSNMNREDNWAKRVATLVTNGPFTLKELNHQSGEFALQRNQYYRRNKGSSSAISKYVTPQYLTTTWQTSDMSLEEYEKFLTENVILHFADDEGNQNLKDSFYFIGELPIALRKAETYAEKVVVKDLLSVSTCILNTAQNGNPVLANENIRLALSTVIDRDFLASELVYAKAATGLITPGVYEPGKKTDFRNKDNSLISTDADLESANDLIDQGLDQLGLSRDQLGELRLVYSGDSVNDAYIAKYLKSVWDSLGFDVVLDAVYGEQRSLSDETVVLDSVLQSNYNAKWEDCRQDDIGTDTDDAVRNADVLLVDYQMLATNALATLAAFSTERSGNGFDMTDKSEDGSKEFSYQFVPHVCGYASAEYDTLIENAYAAETAKDRASILHEAEEMLLASMPVIPLVFNQDYYLISDTLTKIKTNAYGMPIFTKTYQKGYKDLMLSGEENQDGE